jgi:rRNA maturation RNase YbeY
VRDLGKEFLGHDYDTDVITFDLSEEDAPLAEGEIYIAVAQAEAQAKEYGTTLTAELKRLAVHGALHLCGYDDSTDELRSEMSRMENMFI